jgi:hypothetical protein
MIRYQLFFINFRCCYAAIWLCVLLWVHCEPVFRVSCFYYITFVVDRVLQENC